MRAKGRMVRGLMISLNALVVLLGASCGPVEGTPFAVEVISVSLGQGGGFGEAALPDVVLGSPEGNGDLIGSTDVLSLGFGGDVILRFDHIVEEAEGPELLVFENVFLDRQSGEPFREACAVEVALEDGPFVAFDCAAESEELEGCAGRTPVYLNESVGETLQTLGHEGAGGDAFDLAGIDLKAFDRVRIRDASLSPSAEGNTTHGCDLDAVAVTDVLTSAQ